MHLNTFSFWRGGAFGGACWEFLMHAQNTTSSASASEHRILLKRATMSGRSMLQAAFGNDPPNRHSHYIVVVFLFFFPLCCWSTNRRLFTHTGKRKRENAVDDFRRQLHSGEMGLGQLPTVGRINSIGGYSAFFYSSILAGRNGKLKF